MKIVALAMLSLLLTRTVSVAQHLLSPDEFDGKLARSGQAILLDVRTPGEYREGHLANALNIDYRGTDFKDKIARLDKTKPVFVYCLAGGRSAAAAEILQKNGFKEVYDMNGGYLKWTAAQKPVTVSPTAAKKENGLPLNEFKKWTASEQPVLIDFYAPWCGPCIKMKPMIAKLSKEYNGKAQIKTINYDENKSLAAQLGISELPVLQLYKNGKLLWTGKGLQTEKDLRKILDTHR